MVEMSDLRGGQDGQPRRPQKGSVRTRPTVVIGLGGQGTLILDRLKQRYGRSNQAMNRIGLLALDTDPLDTSEAPHLNEQTEFYHMSVMRPTVYLDRHEDDLSWWPEGYETDDIVQGAHQVRPVGRLSFMFNVDGVRDAISQIRNRVMTGMRTGDDTAVSFNPKIYVVGSLAGGTGSGTFLDVAYNARDIFGGAQSRATVTGMFCLADVFLPVVTRNQRSQVQANSYAALKELDFFNDGSQRGSDITLEYPQDQGSPVRVDADYRPFDVTYLVERTNRNNVVVAANPEQMASLIADAVFLECSAPLGQDQQSDFDNVSTGRARGRLAGYSGLGTRALVYPGETLERYAAVRCADEVLESSLLTEPDDVSAVQESVEDYLATVDLHDNQGRVSVVDLLDRDPRANGNRFKLDVRQQVEEVEDGPREEYRENLEEIEDSTEALLEDIKSRIEDNSESAIRGTDDQPGAASRMSEAVSDLLRNSGVGAKGALMWLDMVQRRLRAGQDLLRNRVETKWEGQRGRKSSLDTERNELLEMAQEGMISRWRFLGDKFDDYERALQAYVDREIEESLHEAAIDLLRELEEKAGGLQTHLRNDLLTPLERLSRYFSSKKRQLRNDLEQMAEVEASRTQNVNLESVVGADHIDDFYRRTAPELEDFLRGEVFAEEGLNSLRELETDDEVGDWLLEKVSDRFSSLPDRVIVDDVMKGILELDEEEIARRVGVLFEQCAPQWDVIRAQYDGGSSLPYIGVNNKEDNVFVTEGVRGLSSGNVAQTHDPRRIDIYRTEHGIPLYALDSVYQLHAKYRDTLRRNERIESQDAGLEFPVHMFEIADEMAEVFPREEAEALQTFAVGVALGEVMDPDPPEQELGVDGLFIYNRGSYYYMRDFFDREDVEGGRIPEEVDLGQGRVDAFETFQANPDYHAAMRRWIEYRGEKPLGVDALSERIREYMTTLRRAVRRAEDQGGERRSDRADLLRGEERELQRYLEELQEAP